MLNLHVELDKFYEEKNDRLFIIKLLISYSIESLKCIERLVEEKFQLFVFPLYRQIYESCIYIIALNENIISLDNFINSTWSELHNEKYAFFNETSKNIYNKLHKEYGGLAADTIKDYLKYVYSYLSKHTHLNFDSLHFFTIHEFSESKLNFVNYEIYSLKSMLLPVFYALCNEILETNIKLNSNFTDIIQKQLNEMKETKIETNKVLARLMKIEDYKVVQEARKKETIDMLKYLGSEEGKNEFTEYINNLKKINI